MCLALLRAFAYLTHLSLLMTVFGRHNHYAHFIDKEIEVHLLHCWWECKLVQPLWKTIWRFLKKLKTELPYDPAIPLLGIYLNETIIQKDTCTPMFNAVLLTIAKIRKQAKCLPVDGWIKKMWHVHTMEYYSVMRKKDIMPFVTTWIDRMGIMLSEVSQREKDKYCLISLTCRSWKGQSYRNRD